jgi:hypothetical protein
MKRYAALILVSLLAAVAAPAAHANTLSGTVRYRDKEFSTADGSVTATPMLPARYVALDFVRAADLGTVLGSTTTDGAGRFTSPNLGAHADILVLVKATGTYENQTVFVRDQSPGGGALQTYQSPEFDLTAGHVAGAALNITDDAIAGAFNIYDCFIRAHRYVREQLFPAPPTIAGFSVTVRWEDGKDSEDGSPSTSYFTVIGGERIMNILGDTAVDSDAFDDAVIIHEYGHLAAHLYSKDDSPGGSHMLGDVLDLRLAFSEGWADFFSCAVRDTRWYVDTNAAAHLLFEIATPAVTGAPGVPVTGPENELAVSAVLWDIVAAVLTIHHGAVDTPREALWDIFDNYLPQPQAVDVCLEDFWDGWFEDAATPAYGSATLANRATLVAIVTAHDVRYFEDEQENDGTSGDATEVDFGEILTGTHYHDENDDGVADGDRDWFRFRGEEDTTYTIETFNLGNAGDTVLHLFAERDDDDEDDDDDEIAHGVLLATSDDHTPGTLASRIVYTVPDSGQYYVRVTRAAKPLPIIDPPPDDPDPAQGARANYGYYSFRVTEGGAMAGPTVTLINPHDGAADVPVDTTVVATFSQPVQLTTVTTDSFTLTAVTTPVPGNVTLDASRTVATFTPTTTLLPSTTYTVNLTADIKDDGDRALTAFTSTFRTADSGAPAGPVPRVPRAQVASGDGFVDIEWVYPAAPHDGVIVAVGFTRFPTIAAVTNDGTTELTVGNGTEIYRGNTETTQRVAAANGGRVFVAIWTFIGTTVSRPYYLATRAARGGRGILEPLNPGPDPGPQPGGPTLAKPAKFQAVSGDGYVDVEWVEAAGDFDGVIVAVGSNRFPTIRQVVEDGELKLVVSHGAALIHGDDRVRFRLPTGNGVSRLFCIWTFKGAEFSRPLYAATRASRGGRGLDPRRSFYGDGFEEPELLN